MEKTFQRASNAGVNFFLARVKCVPSFTLFCCKSELFCNFALLGGNTEGFLFGKYLNIAVKRGFIVYYYIIVASIDVWQSYFAYTCCQTHFTLFFRKFTFVASYALSQVKLFLLKPCWGKKLSFSMSGKIHCQPTSHFTLL